jgi:transposase
MQQFVGVDIAKRTFHADVHGQVRAFSNDAAGAAELLELTSPESIYILEATGSYSRRLAEAIYSCERQVRLINPLSSRRFAQLQLRRVKNDRVDARLLTEYGSVSKEKPFVPASDDTTAARQHQTTIEQLIKQQTALQNQLEAILQWPTPAAEVVQALRSLLKQLGETIEGLRKSMRSRLDRAHPGMVKRVQSVPGFGQVNATLLVAATDGFTAFASAKNLVSYVGVCPNQYQSGTSVEGRTKISRLSNAVLRTKLYMGAMAAIRGDNEFSELFQRLSAAGKPRKLALIAVINKMLRVAYAVATSGTGYRRSAPADV